MNESIKSHNSIGVPPLSQKSAGSVQPGTLPRRIKQVLESQGNLARRVEELRTNLTKA